MRKIALLAVLLGGCYNSCWDGEDGGRCYRNGTCDKGLVCLRTHVPSLKAFKVPHDEMCVHLDNVKINGEVPRLGASRDGGTR